MRTSEFFLYLSFFSFFFLSIGVFHILLVCFGLAVGHPVLIDVSFFYAFAYQKKKNSLAIRVVSKTCSTSTKALWDHFLQPITQNFS